MKVYLTLDELKRIRDDIYSARDRLNEQVKEKPLVGQVAIVVEDAIAEREKTLIYINQLIKDASE